MDTYEGAFEFWPIEDAKEIGECASSGDILCADCALAQQLMAAEDEAEREKEQ